MDVEEEEDFLILVGKQNMMMKNSFLQQQF